MPRPVASSVSPFAARHHYVYGGVDPRRLRLLGLHLLRLPSGRHLAAAHGGGAAQASAQRVSSPQPGDLVFFGYPAYHVGIYAGGGMMYDSPTTGKTTGLHQIWSSNVTYGRP